VAYHCEEKRKGKLLLTLCIIDAFWLKVREAVFLIDTLLWIFFFYRYPGVLSDVQEEKGIKYKFEVYEKND